MTTTYYETGNRTNFLGTLVLLIMGVVAVGVFAVIVARPNSTHAIDRHGSVMVTSIRECMSNSNTNKQVWKSRIDANKFFNLCQLPDGKWGLQPVLCVAGKWVELTAFIPADGTWSGVSRYMENFSTKFKGNPACK